MTHCFIVTSAVNSRFGVYTPAVRLAQTLDTISSIRRYVPDAKVVLLELTGVSPTKEQADALIRASDVYLDFSEEASVRDLYNSTENWDIVKNGTELMCFGSALALLQADGEFVGVDRVHKMSGRYLLNDQFSISLYEQFADKIVIGQKHKSQFPVEATQQPWQYMARLWSWPIDLLDEVITVYNTSWAHFTDRVTNGGYIDIEHALAKFLDPNHVHEAIAVGVEGTIAPTGATIKD